MWIRAMPKPPAHACIASGYFCTVGIPILEKKVLENQLSSPKKNPAFAPSFQRQNRQGFLRFDRLELLILQVFFYMHSGKRLTERRYSFISSIKKMITKKRFEFSFIPLRKCGYSQRQGMPCLCE